MKRILIGLCALAILSVRAENTLTVREINWQQIKNERPETPGSVENSSAPEGHPALLLENSSGQPRTFELLAIPNPGIKTVQYAVSGRIKYENVIGDGYMEMWSQFGDGHYFSRTLGVAGPMRKIQGTSGWREFALPFDSTGAPAKLNQLKINLVLPGNGKVWIGPLQISEVTLSGMQTRAWWSDQTAGWVGGIGGALLGILFAACGWLAQRGKARGIVLAFHTLILVFGALSVVAGLCAVFVSQPYGVYYPLLLIGVLGIVFGALGLTQCRRKYADDEYRKMLAADAH